MRLAATLDRQITANLTSRTDRQKAAQSLATDKKLFNSGIETNCVCVYVRWFEYAQSDSATADWVFGRLLFELAVDKPLALSRPLAGRRAHVVAVRSYMLNACNKHETTICFC